MNTNQQRDYLTPGYDSRPPLPNATTSLIMGILSIVICGIGVVMGIIGVVMANKDLKLYNNNPGMYSDASLGHTKTGKICSIIGIILSGFIIVLYIGIFIFAFIANDFK
jgi:M penetrans paralogue family 26